MKDEFKNEKKLIFASTFETMYEVLDDHYMYVFNCKQFISVFSTLPLC